MVRTRADATVTKVSAAKAPRKVFTASGAGSSSSSSSSSTPSKASKYSGGNSYNPQPVPEWQKGIGSFFKTAEVPQSQGQGTSGGKDSASPSPSPSPPFSLTLYASEKWCSF
ncbi:PCNA-associated factor-like [Portunus trituberculatus]|uniref:PCNA-associated factor-like n=1 Tax=Portunus trituberculatus TaxID=210409 RepID=UPI001E1CB6D1|nr:PCNA-associated factor-like [Portunus trituberculatus]